MYYYGNIDSITRHWTNEALMCYERGCRCTGCINKKFFDEVELDYKPPIKCQMKRVVIELVRKFGRPIIK